jgi:dTDP-4-dehydrorhamnose 3,5-epimerase
VRRTSPTCGRWIAQTLSADEGKMLWIPPGFAHGFLALSDGAELVYKVTDYRFAHWERTILWSDGDLAIPWPVDGTPIVSRKDADGTRFRAADLFP